MLTVNPLIAALEIDWSGGERPHAAQSAARELVRHIIGLADERAWKVREESVYVRRTDGHPREWMSTFDGIWSPRHVTFVGGEYDGDELEVRREADGLPLPLLRLPYRSNPYMDADTHPHPNQTPTYERVGIDPIRDVWVYRLIR